MSTGISGSKTVFNTSMIGPCSAAVCAGSIGPTFGLSPAVSAGGAVSALVSNPSQLGSGPGTSG